MSRFVLFAGAFAALLALAHSTAFPTDFEGVFTRTDAKKASLCPKVINQTSFQGIPGKKEWILPHNTIIQGGKRCDGVKNERSTRFYEGSSTRAGYPAGLKEALTNTGQNVDIDFKLNQTSVAGGPNGETYYVGWESLGRFCKGTRFLNGTTMFLFRPFNNVEMPIRGFKTLKFGVGKKHMIIVPRFADAVCVYEAPVPPSVNDTKAPTGNGNGTGTAPVPAPGGSDTTTPEDPTTDVSPSPEESPGSASGGGGSVCFPGRASVDLRDGSTKKMSEIEIGDVVRTGPASFSRVFMFTHRIAKGSFNFVRLATASGRSIELTEDHYLYVNGRLTAAGSVVAGDLLDGDRVTRVSAVRAEGLFNPQTEDGDIVVNGVRASAYTQAVDPGAAHAMLAPLRAAFEYLGLATAAIESGADGLAKLCPSGPVAY